MINIKDTRSRAVVQYRGYRLLIVSENNILSYSLYAPSGKRLFFQGNQGLSISDNLDNIFSYVDEVRRRRAIERSLAHLKWERFDEKSN